MMNIKPLSGLLAAVALTGTLAIAGAAHAESGLAECADALDNDSDTLIDLNDPGCACSASVDLFTSTASYISNASFEDYSSCPTGFSQLDRCDDWQQATNATSDYFACGFESTSTATSRLGTFPSAPDGSAFAGAIMQNGAYIEYVGGCTSSTLTAGIEYTFQVYVAAPTGASGGYGGDTAGEIQLFGVESCAELPIRTAGTLDGTYDLLDEVTVSLTGGAPYQLITFTFTPATDYDAVVFGPAEDMTIAAGRSGAYVLFDDLTLNATTSFSDEISASGGCASGYTLYGPEPRGVSYQWYQDGEAISGATSSSYSVPFADGDGVYTLRVDDGTDCNLVSNELTVACDADGDGYASAVDCDDTDASINPAAVEVCDAVDNDCDGTVDGSTAVDASTWYADDDGDLYGDAGATARACTRPSGYVADSSDCDDSTASANPGATEYCDGIDNDCDGTVDEDDAADATTWYADTDGDGYGDTSATTQACSQPVGYVVSDDDCDDSAASANPGATEYCDGIDNDCDGTVDGDDAEDASLWYADSDGDGYGEPDTMTRACSQPVGYVADDSDCDDGDAAVSPAALELCDGLDNDCDGTVDEASAVDAATWYADSDGDGFGDATDSVTSCSQPVGYVADSSDCDDTDSDVNPDAEEIWYDGVDQDCDGNDGDQDGDGYALGDDCDDTDPEINPDAEEIWYDGVDQDCDEGSDYDADGDGYDSASYGGDDCNDADAQTYPGAPDDPYDGVINDCDDADEYDADGDGHDAAAYGGDDCDDANSDIHPGAEEIWYDGVDQDCDGNDDDQDEDGFSIDDDCDDLDAGVNPDAEEIWYDGVDQDCDGNDDDQDGDGYAVDDDCDDTDPDAWPGAEGWDQDCNPVETDTGETDTGSTDTGHHDSGGYKFEGGGGGNSCSSSGPGAAAGLGLLPILLGLAGLRRRRSDDHQA